MIKKIYILIFLAIIICSCGKKGDPVYKIGNQNLGNTISRISTFS